MIGWSTNGFWIAENEGNIYVATTQKFNENAGGCLDVYVMFKINIPPTVSDTGDLVFVSKRLILCLCRIGVENLFFLIISCKCLFFIFRYEGLLLHFKKSEKEMNTSKTILNTFSPLWR